MSSETNIKSFLQFTKYKKEPSAYKNKASKQILQSNINTLSKFNKAILTSLNASD